MNLPEQEKELRAALAEVMSPIGNMTDPAERVIKTFERHERYRCAANPHTISALLAEVEALREDKERLDWLESTRSSLYTCAHTEYRPVTDGSNRREGHCVFDGWACGSINNKEKPTVREAIDSALQSQVKGSKE